MGSTTPFILFNVIFSALAALCAFFITYEEWSHHFAQSKKPIRYALEAAVITFFVFMALSSLAIIAFRHFMSPS